MSANPVTKITGKFIAFTTVLYIFLFPLIVIPATPNFFDTNKLAFTVAIAAFNLIAWAVYMLGEKKVHITTSPFTLPLLFIGTAYVISSFFAANNPYDALIGRGIFIPAIIMIVFVAANVIKERRFIMFSTYALIISATVLSFISIFQSLGFGPSNILNAIFNSNIPDTLAFTPAGSPVALITFLLPILIMTLTYGVTRKEALEKVILFLLSAVMGSALILLVLYSFPGKDTAPIFLPHQHGYAIALETLKNPQTALLGYGPEQFANAYNRTRPAALNVSNYWNVRFTSSSNELFHAITTLGFIGLIAWGWIAIAGYKTARKAGSGSLNLIFMLSIGSIFLLFLFIPATLLHLFTFFTLILLWTIHLRLVRSSAVGVLDINLDSFRLVKPDADSGAVTRSVPIMAFLISIPTIILSITVLVFFARAYAAELTFKKSLDAAARNDGVATYNYQRQAIQRNPYSSRYHRAYSATNLALANSIAGKDNITDEDRNNVSQLIQQSIREAKAAVALDPYNSQNWENLTFVYRSLINIAQGADSWTVAALAQAIQNDPVNPRLRLELGGVYYALGRYDQAIRLYQQAAELKPDWANAYYNLAAAHKQKEENELAFDYLRQVLRLVQPDSADYTKAQAEIEELAKLLNVQNQEQIPQAQGELQTPTPIPTQNPETQIEIPGEAGPDNIEEEQVVEDAPAPTTAPQEEL